MNRNQVSVGDKVDTKYGTGEVTSGPDFSASGWSVKVQLDNGAHVSPGGSVRVSTDEVTPASK